MPTLGRLTMPTLRLAPRPSVQRLLTPRRLFASSPPLDEQEQVWEEIWDEAAFQFKRQSWKTGDLKEFGMDSMLHNAVMKHKSLACGLAHSIGGKLEANQTDDGVVFESILRSAMDADNSICADVAADLQRFKVVDPATDGLLGVFLFYKGVQAIACARIAHHYWTHRGEAGKMIARMLQSEMSDVYGVDIHPGCKLGRGITIDHATGVTLGETCVIGDDVYIMHDVTLGATGASLHHARRTEMAGMGGLNIESVN
jgi:serine O-acetyltransferase